jgi:RimJ/RimL family protein N-acetyltransferase
MTQIPEFKTKRLILRDIQESDLVSWQKYFNDYEVIRHLSAHVPWPFPEDGVKTFYEKAVKPKQGMDKWLWGIFLQENPSELVGCVDLWREPKPDNRGFWLAKKHWGKGIMTEAVEPVMDYAFNELGFEILYFGNALGNTRSRRVKEKTGAKFIRVEPVKHVDPQLTEMEIWELKKDDWFKFKATF